MTLRWRLVGALVVLVIVGLGLFGIATYSLYSRSQYDQLDAGLRAAAPQVAHQLEFQAAGRSSTPPPGGIVSGADGDGQPAGATQAGPGSPNPSRDPGGPGGLFSAPGTYGELVGSTGAVLDHVQLPTDSHAPVITKALLTRPAPGRADLYTTGSVSGTERWRVLVMDSDFAPGAVAVVAVPLSSVESSLHRLILIELAGAAILLALLIAGAWEVLRRGLLPLERMAGTAGRIAEGDLTQRVEPAESRSEVGRLGLALNTMLEEIESAFHQRRATEERLRRFLADASHELRTPLTSIQGFAELFRLGADHPQVDLPTIMRRIEEESGRMRLLVEDLLLLARLDDPRPPELAPVDLTVLAADACSDAIAAGPDRQVTLLADEPVVVMGNQSHLRQALANLVSNAIKYTPPTTPIEVGTDLADRAALVTVRDHGPGLDEDALTHAFDRFWQADRSRTGAGAGLGLAIVTAIAQEHGGRAWAVNAPDGGAVFTIELPMPRGHSQVSPGVFTASFGTVKA
jgi:two-component system, OmpR family, sensor kinase